MSSIPPFSLCEGGRFHAALSKAGLTGSVRGRLILVGVFFAIGWLPLVFLSAAAGTLMGGSDLSLLSDHGAMARYFVVVPIMIFAEPASDRVLGIVIDLFRRSGLIQKSDVSVFDAAVHRAERRGTSDTAEFLLLVTALALPHLLVDALPVLPAGTAWFGTVQDGRLQTSAAGQWSAWVSLPLVQFLLLRWLWRIVTWWGLVWQVAELKLSWAAAHPDGAGGLGFFAWSPRAFRLVFVGLSALAASAISNRIQFGGMTLMDARGPILAFILIEALILLTPQFFFIPSLVRARYAALAGYGLVASRVTHEFEHRWTDPAATHDTGLVESAEPSAMADYASVYGLVNSMRPAPISIRDIASTVLPLAAPFLPLLLYQYSLKQIVQEVLQLVR